MGFLSGMVGAVVKTALAPVAIVKDVANVAVGEDANSTKELIQSAFDDVSDATDDLGNGEM